MTSSFPKERITHAKRLTLFLAVSLAALGGISNVFAESAPLCPLCGDGVCVTNENCPDDCGGSICGDGVCDPGEDCPDDCGAACGDGFCTPPENGTSCPDDCTLPSCGNGICEVGENCSEDCGMCETPPTSCGSSAECDDGNACNGIERCSGGICLPGTPLNCDDGDPCTDDVCDVAVGCLHTFNSSNVNCGGAATGGGNNGGGTVGAQGEGGDGETGGTGSSGGNFLASGGGCNSSLMPAENSSASGVWIPFLSLIGIGFKKKNFLSS
ncbi:MAG: hypothetical protein U1F57_09705 [bacterium]